MSDNWNGIGGEYAFNEGYRRAEDFYKPTICRLQAEVERLRGLILQHNAEMAAIRNGVHSIPIE
jgi:hypothetical protein